VTRKTKAASIVSSIASVITAGMLVGISLRTVDAQSAAPRDQHAAAMVPSQRQNMIAWLAARSDPPDYGKLIVYEFPKDKLVYGPFQIEARINQNTEISQQLSLWNQMGSRVIRGNLLVIPIENSILYVSPLYLRAETGQLPELKRVIAAYGDHVVMDETLAGALAMLFKETAPASPPAASAPPGAPAKTSLAGPEADRARELDRGRANAENCGNRKTINHLPPVL